MMTKPTFQAKDIQPFLLLAVLFFTFCVTRPAMATSSAAAEALFREARKLMQAGQIDQACEKFAKSQEVEPSTGTLLNLATCHAQQGKPATAWAEFSKAVGDAERERDNERVEYARAEIAKLEPKLSKITIVGPETEELSVAVDGERVVLNSPLPYDPGSHRVEASAPGKEPFITEVTLGPNADTQTVTIPELEARPTAAHAAATKPAAAESTPVDPTQDVPPEGSETLRKPLAYGLAGLGVVALGAGTGLALSAQGDLDKVDSNEEYCVNQRCTKAGLKKVHAAETKANFATIAFAGGATALGVGVYLLLTAEGDSEGAAKWSPPVLPLVAKGQFGLQATREF